MRRGPGKPFTSENAKAANKASFRTHKPGCMCFKHRQTKPPPPEVVHKMPGCKCAFHRGLAGSLNPNWKGGSAGTMGIGWKAARKIVWERDKVCRACGKPPHLRRRLDVHHIVPRRQGGTNHLDNLAGLHHACHMQVEIGRMTIAPLV